MFYFIMFIISESKTILLPLCMGQLKRHFIRKQEMTLCVAILGDILTSLHGDKVKVTMVTPTITMVTLPYQKVLDNHLTVNHVNQCACTGIIVYCMSLIQI